MKTTTMLIIGAYIGIAQPMYGATGPNQVVHYTSERGSENIDSQYSNSQLAATPAEQLQVIRQHIGISISDLAVIFDKTRPTIYSWIKGGEIKDSKTLNLLQNAAEVAAKLEELELHRADTLLKRPILAGNQTLLSYLSKGKNLSVNELHRLKNIDEKEYLARQASETNRTPTTAITYIRPLFPSEG